jgi:phosphoribosylglycinamide formyltransferase-1
VADAPSLVVLISGSGSNLAALLEACGSGALDARVAAVVSNRAEAAGLRRAEAWGVPALHAPLAAFRASGGRSAYDAHLAETVASFRPTLVVCAGFLHVLSAVFLDRFGAGRVLNLHPALPGDLPGLDAIRRAWDEGAAGLRRRTGVMVHEVVVEVDAGPVVCSEAVDLVDGESIESFTARMHATEHRVLVEAIRHRLRALSA